MICQPPKFTVPRKGRKKWDVGGRPYCLNGWSNEGLEMFNKIARAVYFDHKHRGEEFEQTFKKEMEKEAMKKMNSNKKQKKIKIVTYNDLNGAAELNSEEQQSEEEEEVSIKVFEV
jgi:hypothetical protein